MYRLDVVMQLRLDFIDGFLRALDLVHLGIGLLASLRIVRLAPYLILRTGVVVFEIPGRGVQRLSRVLAV